MTQNSIAQNLQEWSYRHDWSLDGDEWSGQARLCGVPYEVWKHSLIETLILPHVPGRSILEIGAGHGRWSEHIARFANRLVLVDLSPQCIEHCQRRFQDAENVEFFATDGKTLPPLASEIDFVWSYDSFVHMDVDVIRAYMAEIERVLKPGGLATIHHANRRYAGLAFLRQWGRPGKTIYRVLSQGWSLDGDGWRSDVSATMVAELARQAGLHVERQFQYWAGQCGVPRFNDCITMLQKPSHNDHLLVK